MVVILAILNEFCSKLPYNSYRRTYKQYIMTAYNLKEDPIKYSKYKNNVENNDYYLTYIKENTTSRHREDKILGDLTSYCCFKDMGLTEVIHEEKNNEAEVNNHLSDFEQYLIDLGYASSTYKARVKSVRTFFRTCGINIPIDKRKFSDEFGFREQIENSAMFKKFVRRRNLSEGTKDGYLTVLTLYCNFNETKLEDLIKEAEDEEEAGIRLTKRKLKERLLDFHVHLYDLKYGNETAGVMMRKVKFFYKFQGIERPEYVEPNKPLEAERGFEDIPTADHIRRAVEMSNLRNKSIILFMASSGSASKEMRTLTVKEYLRGTNESHGEFNGDDTNIQMALKKMDGDKDTVPIFKIVRHKKKQFYYTCITPEANQYIVNWLKTRDDLTLEDTVFDISKDSVTEMFQILNDKMGLGWVENGKSRFFTSHQLRRWNGTTINNETFSNKIHGRRPDSTTRAYNKLNPAEILKEYKNYQDKLTLFREYKTKVVKDENVKKLEKDLQLKESEMEELRQKNAELEKQVEEDRNIHQTTKQEVSNLKELVKEMSTRLPHLDDNHPTDFDKKDNIRWYILNNGNKKAIEKKEDYTPTKLQEKLMSLSTDEQLGLVDIAYELIEYDSKYDGSEEYNKKIVRKALREWKNNPLLMEKAITHKDIFKEHFEKIGQIQKLVDEILTSDDLYEEDEIKQIKSEILTYLYNNRFIFSQREADEELAEELIEKFE